MRSCLGRLCLLLAVAAAFSLPAQAADAPLSAAQRTAWFRQAKFGMFIHWGLYAIPAGQWNGKEIPGIGEWIMNRAKIPAAEYSKLAGQFNPVKFNAEQWVLVAKEAGMKYMAITSKHHDGFALFSSKVSPYNVVDATPFHRDVVGELAAACQKHGMRLGFYYSQSQDWHHPGGAKAGGDWDEAQKGDFDAYLRTIAEPQVREILGNYGPVSLIWFDTPLNMTEERIAPFVTAIRTLQPNCLINSRLLLRGADIKNLSAEQVAKAVELGCDYISRGDNEIPVQVVPGLWETPATLNDTWGYKTSDNNWKSPEDLIAKLVDIVSKGGNYLLNVGPTAEGLIPEPSVDRLRAMGAWLKVNGEAIYDAGPTPFGHELGRAKTVQQGKKRVQVAEGALDWRCTTKPGKLYIHFLKWPGEKFEFSGVKGNVGKAYLLADRQARELTQAGDKLSVSLPAKAPAGIVPVLCLDIQDKPGDAKP